jgi:hypothetical protein
MPPSAPTIGINVASLPVAQVIPVFFFLVFFVWAVYTIVASYHWLRYSNNTTVALSAISTHLIVSAWLAIYTVSGLR